MSEAPVQSTSRASLTPAEFQQWFSGFMDALGDAHPTPDQWRRVVDSAKAIALPKPPVPFGGLLGASSLNPLNSLGGYATPPSGARG